MRRRMAVLRANDVGAYLRAAQDAKSSWVTELLAGTDACLRSLTQRLRSSSTGAAACLNASIGSAGTSSGLQHGTEPPQAPAHGCHAGCVTSLHRFQVGDPSVAAQRGSWPCRTAPRPGTGCWTA